MGNRLVALGAPFDGSGSPLVPILNAYNPEGTTRHVDFTTSKAKLFATSPTRCHLNYVVYDSDWEAGFAERLEWMPEVMAYVKNHNLGFEVPYEHEGKERRYRPDYIVRAADGSGTPLNLVVEIKGSPTPMFPPTCHPSHSTLQ